MNSTCKKYVAPTALDDFGGSVFYQYVIPDGIKNRNHNANDATRAKSKNAMQTMQSMQFKNWVH